RPPPSGAVGLAHSPARRTHRAPRASRPRPTPGHVGGGAGQRDRRGRQGAADQQRHGDLAAVVVVGGGGEGVGAGGGGVGGGQRALGEDGTAPPPTPPPPARGRGRAGRRGGLGETDRQPLLEA